MHMTIEAGDKPKTRYECETCDLRTEVANVKEDVGAAHDDIGRIYGRLWKFGAGLVLILLLVIANLIAHFSDRPDSKAIAAAVAEALKK